LVAALGGDPDAALPTPRFREIVVADSAGVVSGLDALAVGVAAWRLGAGRARREHDVQSAAGVLCLAKPGAEVRVGQPLFELHTDTPERFAGALADLADAVTIAVAGTRVDRPALIIDVIRER
jgi:thymidine phosphorylase